MLALYVPLHRRFKVFPSSQDQVGLSENSVPLNPMVLLIIIPTKWLFHWGIPHFKTYTGIGINVADQWLTSGCPCR